MSTSTLTREFEYYLSHQSELASQYNGKVIVIKDEQVIGVYSDEITAILETQKSHELGTFLVQVVTPDPAAASQNFHSRVVFS